MLRLSSPTGARLSGATRFDAHVAGSEANVAAAMAQLGVPARWVSRLPAGPLGRRVERELAGLGVTTDAVQWADGSRLGLFFADTGAGSRPTAVTYDRAGSAFAGIEELPAGIVKGSRVVHVSGITPSLGARPAALVAQLADEAAEAGALLSLDVNYRAKLWSAAAARAALTPLATRADVLFCSEHDARAVFGFEGDVDALLADLKALAAAAGLVVLTRAAHGCLAVDGGGRRHRASATATEPLDRFGMGDALVGGVLWGLLEGDVALALRAGVELAALKGTVAGDLVRIEPGELQQRLEGDVDAARVVR